MNTNTKPLLQRRLPDEHAPHICKRFPLDFSSQLTLILPWCCAPLTQPQALLQTAVYALCVLVAGNTGLHTVAMQVACILRLP